MKTCVSTYSFSAYCRSSGASQLDLIPLAKEIGFDAIEFTDLNVPDGMSRKDYAMRLRDKAESLSLPIANYTIGADLLNADDPAAEVERLCRQADIARILGASGMRHDAAWGYDDARRHYLGFENTLPLLAERCHAVTEYASSLGIVTMTENHGQFCQESARVEKLINTVAHPNFGQLVDIGNFLCADDDPASAVGRAALYAKHVHVKDFHIKSGSEPNPGEGFFTTRGGVYLRGAILGHGNVPVLQCLRVLKNAGYDGYVSIEFEGMEDNLSALRIGLDNLKRYISIL